MRPTRTTTIILVPAILMAALLAAGCTGAGSGAASTVPPGTTGTGADATSAIVLTVNGSVDQPLELTLSDLNAYPTVPVNLSANRPGMDMNRTGNPDMAGFDMNNGTRPADAGGDWQPGMGGNMSPGASGNMTFPGGNMPGSPGGQDGNMPSGGNGGFAFGSGSVTGVSLNSLLDKAKASDNATNVTFIGTGGRAVTIPLADIRAHDDAAIVVMGTGLLQVIVPGSSAGSVAGLTGIVVS